MCKARLATRSVMSLGPAGYQVPISVNPISIHLTGIREASIPSIDIHHGEDANVLHSGGYGLINSVTLIACWHFN